jgi:3-hydroxyacyl-CoA dehydrogenase
MRLLEIVRGRETSPEAVATSLELARRLKKVGVVVGNCFGFLGNRMFKHYRREAVRLVEEGCTPAQVDLALTEWGMAMGPLAVGDLSGLDVIWLIRQEALRLGIPHVPANSIEDWLYARGRYGQKTGAGWYRYDEQRRALEDPEVETLAAEYAAAQAIPRRSFEPREIRERTLFALVNEGARLLEEGIALRAVDIDIAYIHGYGFPAWRGGPMHWASAFGLEKVLAGIERFYDTLGPHWKPAGLLASLAARGKGFE